MPTLRTAYSCAAALFFLFSCNNKKTSPGREVQQSSSSSNMMAPQEEPFNTLDFHNGYNKFITQRFIVPADKVSVIKAAKGLKISLDPSVLEKENGGPVNDIINVSIIELTSSEDLFKSDAATVSNGRLLQSGGSYYIGMESGGEKLCIKKGRSLIVEFPKIRKAEMELFYGQRDSMDNMNWKPAGESLEETEGSIGFTDDYYARDSVYTVTSVVEPDKKKYSYSFISGRIFHDLNTSVFFYDKLITLSKLLDTVNRYSQILCLDSVSFWPANLPKNRTLDTNYLVTVYGPRFQYMLKRCECNEPDITKDAVSRTDTLVYRRMVSSLAEQIQKYYAASQISSLGWINCDRYYNDPEPCDMQFQIPITFNNNTNIQFFVLFKKFSGLLNGSTKLNEQKAIIIQKLPLNEEVTLIAFTKSKGVIYQARADFKTSKNQYMSLDFKEISIAEMNKMFGRNVKI